MENNFSWVLGGNFDTKQRESQEFFDPLYNKTLNDFANIFQNTEGLKADDLDYMIFETFY